MKTIIIALLLMCNPAFAFDEWTKGDSYAEAAYLTLQYIDWKQSREIQKHPEKYQENNFILGKHPTQAEADRYNIIAAVAHFGIAYMLPRKYRDFWQYSTIGMETAIIYNNKQVGLQIRF